MNCDNCKFWEKLQGDQGGCRRYPPTVHSRVEQQYVGVGALDRSDVVLIESTCPQTKADDWCGEFSQRRQPPAPLPPPGPAPRKFGWGA